MRCCASGTRTQITLPFILSIFSVRPRVCLGAAFTCRNFPFEFGLVTSLFLAPLRVSLAAELSRASQCPEMVPVTSGKGDARHARRGYTTGPEEAPPPRCQSSERSRHVALIHLPCYASAGKLPGLHGGASSTLILQRMML